jgi:hypothetical protein
MDEHGLEIKFNSSTYLDATLKYNGVTIPCEKLELYLEAGEIPKVHFHCVVIGGVDVEIRKLLASASIEIVENKEEA